MGGGNDQPSFMQNSVMHNYRDEDEDEVNQDDIDINLDVDGDDRRGQNKKDQEDQPRLNP